jgi:putative endonuclease
MKNYYVYMVFCSDGSYYIGMTNDVESRIAQHNFGVDPNSYTFSRRPVLLVYSSSFSEVTEAIACEKQLKGWSRRKKAALARGDWVAIKRFSWRRSQ